MPDFIFFKLENNSRSEIKQERKILSPKQPVVDQKNSDLSHWKLCLDLRKIDELAAFVFDNTRWNSLTEFLKKQIDRDDYPQMPYLLDLLNAMINLLPEVEHGKKRKLTLLKGYLYASIEAHDLAFQEYDKIGTPQDLLGEENLMLAEAYLHAPYFQHQPHIEERGKIHANYAARQGNQEAHSFLVNRFDNEYQIVDEKSNNRPKIIPGLFFSQVAKKQQQKNLRHAHDHCDKKMKAQCRSDEFTYYAKWGLLLSFTGIGLIVALVLFKRAQEQQQQVLLHQRLEAMYKANAWLDVENLRITKKS